MLKKILSILAVALLIGYIVFAIVSYTGISSNDKCKGVEVVIKDSMDYRFVSAAEIQNILKQEHIKLIGKRLKDINYQKIEATVASHKLISHAECYSSPSGKVYINVWQHVPIIRIMSASGNYYLDQDGKKTGLSLNSAADVVVASGAINDSLTLSRLYQMALLLRNDSFWDSQIEQIDVQPGGEWILIPRVGDYEILLGYPYDIEEKLHCLRLFYQNGLPKVGWERYSTINLKFKNQIVCTKKK